MLQGGRRQQVLLPRCGAAVERNASTGIGKILMRFILEQGTAAFVLFNTDKQ